MNNEELKEVIGGKVTATLLNTLVRAVEAILDFGRTVGTVIRRSSEGKICSVK